MTSKTEIIEKVQKVKALAERGVGGEKENAARMVEQMMAEHGITEEDLRDDVVTRRWFRYDSKDKHAERLMGQIIYSVLGSVDKWRRGRKAMTGVDCTPAQEIEIKSKYEFYYRAYRDDLDAFYLAFINKNNIFPAPELVVDDEDEDMPERTAEEQATIDRALSLMGGLDAHQYRERIGGN